MILSKTHFGGAQARGTETIDKSRDKRKEPQRSQFSIRFLSLILSKTFKIKMK